MSAVPATGGDRANAGAAAAPADHGRIVPSGFVPHPLLRGPHAQTIVPSLLRPLPALDFRVQRLELPDGDFVDIGWCEDGAPPGSPRVLLLHGLTGGFESKYLRATARRLQALGLRCVILQMRGAGPEPNRLHRSYHQGASDDLAEFVTWLAAQEPGTPLAAVGWSLGANVLLKYLGEAGVATPLVAAVAASAPFELRPCAERLRSGFSRLYQNRLLRDLKAGLARKYSDLPSPGDLARAFAARDFFEYDDAHTAVVNGYRDAEDYYARAACGQYLRGIRVPTLIVHALDDPFMTPAIVPRAEALAPSVTLELSQRGGHVGFVGMGPAGLPQFWLERRVAAALAAHFGLRDRAR